MLTNRAVYFAHLTANMLRVLQNNNFLPERHKKCTYSPKIRVTLCCAKQMTQDTLKQLIYQ